MSEEPAIRLFVEVGGGLRAVPMDTSVKPSAEPTSIRPASNTAMPVRMVPSSAPMSRASALACGSTTEPATDAVASWVRPACVSRCAQEHLQTPVLP